MEISQFPFELKMKRWFRSRWWWLTLFLLPVVVLIFLHGSTGNVMHPALDELSKVTISERWFTLSQGICIKVCYEGEKK
jgi:hypothetical protein